MFAQHVGRQVIAGQPRHERLGDEIQRRDMGAEALRQRQRRLQAGFAAGVWSR